MNKVYSNSKENKLQIIIAYLIELMINQDKPEKNTKTTSWHLSAPLQKWQDYRHKINLVQKKTSKLLNSSKSMTQKYSTWIKEVENAALTTIGKKQHKNNKKGLKCRMAPYILLKN